MIRRQRQALRNIAAVLEEAGSDLKNVVKVNIFLTSMADFATMNEAWDEVFTWQPKPVRVPHPPPSAPGPLFRDPVYEIRCLKYYRVLYVSLRADVDS